MSEHGRRLALTKMTAAGISPAAIRVFEKHCIQLEHGVTGIIREADIEPLLDIPQIDELKIDPDRARVAMDRTVILKLNGGLGTSMGLDKAKNLLPALNGMTFLDVIVSQVLAARATHGARLPLLLMNSFRTHEDTQKALAAYPDLPADDLPVCFLQNREPKLRTDDLTPVDWPADPTLEWCPPGHGDVYTALYDSGLINRLLVHGYEYLFLSNGDNLGAAPDARMAGWFAASGAPYAAELCRRTANDRKGGHLAIRKLDGQLVLRDTAQTAPEEMDFFTDESRHPFFHTNNLWIRLSTLKEVMRARDCVLDLPLIRNEKTVDPTNPTSPKVIQLESAMGAAVGVFPGATAIGVSRERFVPVKTTNELLLLRSDLHELDDQYRLVAKGRTPAVWLDHHFKLIHDFTRRVPFPLHLRRATSLTVTGDVSFGQAVHILGDVDITSQGPLHISDGTWLGTLNDDCRTASEPSLTC